MKAARGRRRQEAGSRGERCNRTRVPGHRPLAIILTPFQLDVAGVAHTSGFVVQVLEICHIASTFRTEDLCVCVCVCVCVRVCAYVCRCVQCMYMLKCKGSYMYMYVRSYMYSVLCNVCTSIIIYPRWRQNAYKECTVFQSDTLCDTTKVNKTLS